MLKKAIIGTALAAAVVGGGGAALAATGTHDSAAGLAASSSSSSATPAGTASTKTTTNKHGNRKHRDALRRALHATWVTKNGKTTGTYVTHDAIRGTVTAVSPTSITIKAADGVSQTYSVTSATKVRKRTATTGTKTTGTKAGHRAATSTISAVKTGDKAAVLGTGTTSLTALHVIDGLRK